MVGMQPVQNILIATDTTQACIPAQDLYATHQGTDVPTVVGTNKCICKREATVFAPVNPQHHHHHTSHLVATPHGSPAPCRVQQKPTKRDSARVLNTGALPQKPEITFAPALDPCNIPLATNQSRIGARSHRWRVSQAARNRRIEKVPQRHTRAQQRLPQQLLYPMQDGHELKARWHWLAHWLAERHCPHKHNKPRWQGIAGEPWYLQHMTGSAKLDCQQEVGPYAPRIAQPAAISSSKARHKASHSSHGADGHIKPQHTHHTDDEPSPLCLLVPDVQQRLFRCRC